MPCTIVLLLFAIILPVVGLGYLICALLVSLLLEQCRRALGVALKQRQDYESTQQADREL